MTPGRSICASNCSPSWTSGSTQPRRCTRSRSRRRRHSAGLWERAPVTADLKAEARRRGLWNLFLTGKAAQAVRKLDPSLLPDPQLTNLQYAPLAEITGWSGALAPEALNCAAPDTGNMELLAEFGSPDQQAEWLIPLLEGRIRSAFCMTEPDVASSDATNIATAITADGDGYVINGRKWWSSGAMSSDCKIFIVMGVTGEPGAAGERSHSRHSMTGAEGNAGDHGQARHEGLRLHRRDILVVLVLPMPTWLVDIGLSTSITLSVLILMVAIWIEKPLDFSSFPTVLLVATLLRLALNLATVRLILAGGHKGLGAAGSVIKGFAAFVVGGDFVIGVVVFAILVVINFMVITKGAGRIAEVAARFSLDAMPGKQMAIDADLSAGMIN